MLFLQLFNENNNNANMNQIEYSNSNGFNFYAILLECNFYIQKYIELLNFIDAYHLEYKIENFDTNLFFHKHFANKISQRINFDLIYSFCDLIKNIIKCVSNDKYKDFLPSEELDLLKGIYNFLESREKLPTN